MTAWQNSRIFSYVDYIEWKKETDHVVRKAFENMRTSKLKYVWSWIICISHKIKVVFYIVYTHKHFRTISVNVRERSAQGLRIDFFRRPHSRIKFAKWDCHHTTRNALKTHLFFFEISIDEIMAVYYKPKNVLTHQEMTWSRYTFANSNITHTNVTSSFLLH